MPVALYLSLLLQIEEVIWNLRQGYMSLSLLEAGSVVGRSAGSPTLWGKLFYNSEGYSLHQLLEVSPPLSGVLRHKELGAQVFTLRSHCIHCWGNRLVGDDALGL